MQNESKQLQIRMRVSCQSLGETWILNYVLTGPVIAAADHIVLQANNKVWLSRINRILRHRPQLLNAYPAIATSRNKLLIDQMYPATQAVGLLFIGDVNASFVEWFNIPADWDVVENARI